jgi:mRNA-degrading endonuclease toxin of MazEF toxin-antitoxin module
MFNKFSRETTLIVVSTTEVRITSLEIVLSPRSLFKGRILIRTIRTRERSK